jgi:tRNA wybutosine-synthesizing protein 3
MGKDSLLGKNRFSMVKETHRKSLEKAIREKKADELMHSVCGFIASTKGFFTSSSCAGRIILLQLPFDENKRDASFHRKWHRKVGEKELWKAVEEKTAGELWFKLDPFILHIGTKDLKAARKILECMKKAGVKRGGVIVAKEGKFLVEMQGTQVIAFPVKKDEKVLVGKDFMAYALKRANEKLGKNYALLKKLEKVFRKELK